MTGIARVKIGGFKMEISNPVLREALDRKIGEKLTNPKFSAGGGIFFKNEGDSFIALEGTQNQATATKMLADAFAETYSPSCAVSLAPDSDNQRHKNCSVHLKNLLIHLVEGINRGEQLRGEATDKIDKTSISGSPIRTLRYSHKEWTRRGGSQAFDKLKNDEDKFTDSTKNIETDLYQLHLLGFGLYVYSENRSSPPVLSDGTLSNKGLFDLYSPFKRLATLTQEIGGYFAFDEVYNTGECESGLSLFTCTYEHKVTGFQRMDQMREKSPKIIVRVEE